MPRPESQITATSAETPLTMAARRACVIGAGLGGLALAIRLQAAGVPTTLIEAREQAGGRAGGFTRDGFTFASGPQALTDPLALRALWDINGDDIARDVRLDPVEPVTRFLWPDGTSFDVTNEADKLRGEVARLAPGDLAGVEDFLRYLRAIHAEMPQVPRGWRDLRGLGRLFRPFARHNGWRSLAGIVARHVESPRLRDVFAFAPLLRGASPQRVRALDAGFQADALTTGAWWPQGGMDALIAALVARFKALGGTLRLHDPVLHIHTLGDEVSEIETVSGWRQRFDMTASNADLIHTFRDLLAASPKGPERARGLAKREWSPGAFLVHFGLEGAWPGIAHHTVLLPQRFDGFVDGLFDHGVLARDLLISLSHPSLTDPRLAPAGKSAFTALVPVANTGRLPIDWEQIGPMIESRVLDEIGRRLIPDIHDRIVTRTYQTPRGAALDFSAHLGSGWGLTQGVVNNATARVPLRDTTLTNLYFVGASTRPGQGVAGVFDSARDVANLMLENIR